MVTNQINRSIFGSVIVFCALLGLQVAQAAPQLASAGASFGTTISLGPTTTITQTTPSNIINWSSYNVGVQEKVIYNQPNAESISLNRISDANASQIFGTITANGQIFLMNPNGIVFGQTAQVNVGSLFATTQNISDLDFMAGNFNKFAFVNNTGVITNQGTLKANDGGYIALLGSQVNNSGTITVTSGKVLLGAGPAVVVNFDGAQNLLSFKINPAVQTPTPGAVLTNVVNNSGVVNARGVATLSGGQIQLLGDGDVVNTGTLRADAGSNGNGGSVVLQASHDTIFNGAITAKGGSVSGDGGFAEISAINDLTINGAVDLTAAHGNFGTVLYDPTVLKILPGAGSGAANTISQNQIQSATANVQLQADDITANNNGSNHWSTAGNLQLQNNVSFSLNATGAIDVSLIPAIITQGSGNFTAHAANTITLPNVLTIGGTVDIASQNRSLHLGTITSGGAQSYYSGHDIFVNNHAALHALNNDINFTAGASFQNEGSIKTDTGSIFVNVGADFDNSMGSINSAVDFVLTMQSASAANAAHMGPHDNDHSDHDDDQHDNGHHYGFCYGHHYGYYQGKHDQDGDDDNNNNNGNSNTFTVDSSLLANITTGRDFVFNLLSGDMIVNGVTQPASIQGGVVLDVANGGITFIGNSVFHELTTLSNDINIVGTITSALDVTLRSTGDLYVGNVSSAPSSAWKISNAELAAITAPDLVLEADQGNIFGNAVVQPANIAGEITLDNLLASGKNITFTSGQTSTFKNLLAESAGNISTATINSSGTQIYLAQGNFSADVLESSGGNLSISAGLNNLNGRSITIGEVDSPVGTTITSGNGNNTISLDAADYATGGGGPVIINTGNGDTTVNLATGHNRLNRIKDAFTVNGGDGLLDTLNLSDTANTSGVIYAVDATHVGFLGTNVFYNNLNTLNLNTGSGSDTFNVSPSVTTNIIIKANQPVLPTVPGDKLNYDGQGVGLTIDLLNAEDGSLISTGYKPLNYASIETPNLSNIANLVFNGIGNGNILIDTGISSAPNNGHFNFNGGPDINYTNLSGFTFSNTGTGNRLDIINPAGSIVNFPNGVIYTNAGGSALNIYDGNADSVVYIFNNNNNALALNYGTIDMTKGSSFTHIAYSGISPITDTVTVVSRAFDYLTNTNKMTTLSDDDALDSNDLSKISLTATEDVTFKDPTGMLTISSQNGTDIVNVVGVDGQFTANLSIFGDKTHVDTVNFIGNLNVGLGVITVGTSLQDIYDIKVNPGVMIQAGGTISFNAAHNFIDAGSVASADGDVDISAGNNVSLNTGTAISADNVALLSTGGNIVFANGSVVNAVDIVSLQATTGEIDGSAAGATTPSIVADQLAMTAWTGINVVTQVNKLAAADHAGSLTVYDYGSALTVANVPGAFGTVYGASLAVGNPTNYGNILITTHPSSSNTLMINSNVDNAGLGGQFLYSPGNIVVGNHVLVGATDGGVVIIWADGTFTTNPTSYVLTNQQVDIIGGTGINLMGDVISGGITFLQTPPGVNMDVGATSHGAPVFVSNDSLSHLHVAQLWIAARGTETLDGVTSAATANVLGLVNLQAGNQLIFKGMPSYFQHLAASAPNGITISDNLVIGTIADFGSFVIETPTGSIIGNAIFHAGMVHQ